MTDTNKNLNNPKTKKQILSGIVVSDKMKDTVVVEVERIVKHPKYGKFLKRHKRYKAHNPGGGAKLGERVTIEECRPISKDKHFKVLAK